MLNKQSFGKNATGLGIKHLNILRLAKRYKSLTESLSSSFTCVLALLRNAYLSCTFFDHKKYQYNDVGFICKYFTLKKTIACIVFSFLLIGLAATTQISFANTNNGRTMEMVDLNGNSLLIDKYGADIEGSPFFIKGWMIATPGN